MIVTTLSLFAKRKESTTQTNYGEILKKLEEELQSQQINSSAQVNNGEYNDPIVYRGYNNQSTW